MRTFLVLAVATAALMFNGRAEARYEGPWCAVQDIGFGGIYEDCSMPTLERCRHEVIAGNRGFCNPNPRWPGWYDTAYEERPRARHRKRRAKRH